MALVSLRQVLDHAAEHGYGVPAFNVNNMEQVLSIMNAAQKTDSPVILQASRGARNYAGDIMIRHMIQAVAEMYPDIPVVMHQDHGNSMSTCLSAIANGFSSVMMDGSLEEDAKTPASYEYNCAVTGKVAEAAHMVGVSVEGELGCLGSLETGKGDKEDGHGFEGTLDHSMLLTDPDEAADFVARTKVDALAVAIGTSHGAYKFTREPTGDILAMTVIKEIHKRLPDTHLVMHGSSTVPKDLQELINDHGGAMPETWGVPVAEIVEGIKNGVRKVNIDTDCRMAITGSIRKVLADKPEEFDPRKYLKPSMEAMQKVCEDRYEAFGTAGKASKIKPIPLAEMAKRYASGELDPKIKTQATAA
ncbi:class II fructose-bisphosphate aldolase [Roseospira goensis]|uniref:Fructose-1,6-bisphosphate aldolase n=1 Tax=Roseospira goensis TaxID=391922 RepID=A0A7W6RY17_9PROT|nr:class II fructose-bisphosphate aldolase [Roseospira goensis]MBB4285350.1 fructose-bisphosphate aldolase class II [Roseospira goensis]